MSELAIGIDLGTSNSCVAIVRGRRVEVLPNAYGESITASVVSFHDESNIVVGNAAKANIIHDPRNTVSSAKRLIGRYFFSEEVKKAQAVCSYSIVGGPNHSVRIKVRDEEFSLPEISAMVLREMKLIAEERLGHEVRKAVITVPAYFNDNQRQATKDAGRIAGLEVLRLLNEPTAAALAYGFGKGVNQRVAVYDLGGGTFDISVLEIGKDVFEVLSTCGDTYLGGDDLDDRIIDLVADEFAAREGINLRNDVYALEKLKLASENAKKGLSVEDEVEINIPDIITGPDGQPRSIQRRFTNPEFSSLVMDLIQRTFKVCDEALQQANMIARDLDGVILVGGPTRLPVIRDAVAEYFQQQPKTDVDPDEVVAMGAAIHASSLMSSTQEAYLLDVTPLSLRIGVAGGLAESVIERNTPVPIEQTRTFTTFQDFQESVNIRVYQGESRQAGENELLGQFEFSGFRKARRGEVKIDVTFEINSDGIVNVTATDPETGQRASTQITLSSGLSDQDIARIAQEGRVERVRGGEGSSVSAAAVAPAAAAAAPEAPGAELDLLSEDDLDVLEESNPDIESDLSLGSVPAVGEDLAGPEDIDLGGPAPPAAASAPVVDEIPGPEIVPEPMIQPPAAPDPVVARAAVPEPVIEDPSDEIEGPEIALETPAADPIPFAPVPPPTPDPVGPVVSDLDAAVAEAADSVPTSEDGVDRNALTLPSTSLTEGELGLGDLQEFELTANQDDGLDIGAVEGVELQDSDPEAFDPESVDPDALTAVAGDISDEPEAGESGSEQEADLGMDSLFEDAGSDLSSLYDDSEEV